MLSRKHLIILICIISIFVIAIITIVILKLNSNSTDAIVDESKAYATNETFTTTVESLVEEEHYDTQDFTYSHTEYMTPGQNADRFRMHQLIENNFIDACHKEDTVIISTILDSSTEEVVFVEFTFLDSDGLEFRDTAVVTYDNYDTNNFMRCTTLDYYEYIMSGANVG